ncbi:MAG: DUF2786 domain-containing protein [Nannocystaceae bacterium]
MTIRPSDEACGACGAAPKRSASTRSDEDKQRVERRVFETELEAKLLRALREEWRGINDCYFQGSMSTPLFELGQASTRLGQWCPETRRIELSRELVVGCAWGEVVEVLKHEAAHQYVHEVLRVQRETPHGPSFRRVCHERGIDAAGSGEGARDQVTTDGQPSVLKIVRRVRKLLALAESPNRNEAEAAASAAQRLMLRHNIDERCAHDRVGAASDGALVYRFRHLGRPTGRVFEHQRWLARILADYFFVEVIWVRVYRPAEGKHGSVIEVCGAEENLAMAGFVHEFLLAAAVRSWGAYKREQNIRSNRDRLTYMAGVMRGFVDKLEAQRDRLREEGLIWVPHADLGDYYRRRHPFTRSARSSGQRRNLAYFSGAEAGRTLVLSRPVAAREGAGERSGGRRMLPPA